jgi:hypothetical protein
LPIPSSASSHSSPVPTSVKPAYAHAASGKTFHTTGKQEGKSLPFNRVALASQVEKPEVWREERDPEMAARLPISAAEHQNTDA